MRTRSSGVPDWEDPGLIPAGSVDLVLSQAVMEHVGDVEATYDAIAAWLAPGGVTSHTIDFRSHGLYEPWNGHLAVPDWRWRAMWGRRTPVMNRSLPSAHVDALSGRGLEVVVDQRIAADGGLPRSHLSPTFRSADESDLCTAVSVVQAWRPSTRPGRSVSPNA